MKTNGVMVPTEGVAKTEEKAIIARTKVILDAGQPCPTFDLATLPEPIKSYTEELCSQTAAEPIMIIQSILCTISAIIGRKFCIPEGAYFQKLYGNIWCCTISKSGSFKTTALNKGSAIALKIQKDIQKQIKQLKDVQDSKNDEKIKKLQSKNPILSSRATAEAFTEELSTGQAGQIIASELGAWLKNMNASHAGSVKQILTDFYDVPDSYSYRTRGKGSVIVQEPHITVNGVSTLDWIKSNLLEDDVTSGFLARFFLFYPPQIQLIPAALPQKNDTTRLNSIIGNFENIFQQYRELASPVEYTLTDETKLLFETYHNALYKVLYNETDRTQQILEPFVKRWSPGLLKIAMLMQAVREPLSKRIEVESLQAAQSIIDYAVKSTSFLFRTELGESEHARKCRKIVEYIAKRKGQCTWGQLLSSHTLNGGTKEYEYHCQTLEESGQLTINSANKKKDHRLILNTEK